MLSTGARLPVRLPEAMSQQSYTAEFVVGQVNRPAQFPHLKPSKRLSRSRGLRAVEQVVEAALELQLRSLVIEV